jgi:hypothetical protein
VNGRVDPRLLVGLAAVVSGLALAVLVIGMVGGDSSSRPATYEPFLAGPRQRLIRSIADGGPIFFPDPTGGTRAFYLDRMGTTLVALHVFPPAANEDCPVQWDRKAKRYADCQKQAIDPVTLRRFPVIDGTQSRPDSVYVDLRTLEPAPAPSTSTSSPN